MVNTFSESKLRQCLAEWSDPYTECALPEEALQNFDLAEDGHLHIHLCLAYPLEGCRDQLCESIGNHLQQIPSVSQVSVELTWKIHSVVPANNVRNLQEVRNLIAVASAKGGVGKSTVAVNLALGLAAAGARTGLLDADIYGPSQSIMLGIPHGQRPETRAPKYLLPIEKHGLQIMSMACLSSEKTPLVWRGPMVSSALQQLLGQTLWKDLDYLILDLPPGTGDIPLTLVQKAPLSGAVIVSTPQEVAVLDARKGIEMFRKVKVPVLGIVENMASYKCPHCGTEEEIFSSGGGRQLAAEYDLPLLASLPLDPRIQSQTDSGSPPVITDPEGSLGSAFRILALRVAAQLSRRKKHAENLLHVADITDAAASKK